MLQIKPPHANTTPIITTETSQTKKITTQTNSQTNQNQTKSQLTININHQTQNK